MHVRNAGFHPTTDCEDSCSDGVQNGDETGEDCGGAVCGPCASAGHVVYIGHDYFERSTAIDRVVANAVGLADRADTIRVLGYTALSDVSPGGEVANTNAAITALAPTLGYTVAITQFTSPAELATRIDAADVLIVYEPEAAGAGTMQSLGVTWQPLLEDFLDRGGVLIVCDFGGQSWQLLNGSGLLAITSSSTIGVFTSLTVDVSDPVGAGVPNPYPSTDGSREIRLPTGTEANVVAATATGGAVVVHLER